jgi:hypothetical protein
VRDGPSHGQYVLLLPKEGGNIPELGLLGREQAFSGALLPLMLEGAPACWGGGPFLGVPR